MFTCLSVYVFTYVAVCYVSMYCFDDELMNVKFSNSSRRQFNFHFHFDFSFVSICVLEEIETLSEDDVFTCLWIYSFMGL